MANELITPFLIEQVRAQIAERNSKTFAQFRAPRQSRASVERKLCTDWRCEVIKGYARVSADGQTLEAQHHARQEAGAAQVFAEKMVAPEGIVPHSNDAWALCSPEILSW